MTQAAVVVEGADRFDATLSQLARDLTDLTPANEKAARALLDQADPRTPRQSGQLASSARTAAAKNEATVSYSETYAGPVHNGWEHADANPWLTDTADESTTTLTDVYLDHLDDLVGNVRGA